MKLTMVIPCYNEAHAIRENVRQLWDYFSRRGDEVEMIVVNDGSTDATGRHLLELEKESLQIPHLRFRLLAYGQNRGKGFAVKTGLLQAKQEMVLIYDADLSTPIEELERLAPLLQDYDLVIGSRKQSDAQVMVRQSYLRISLGRAFSWLVKHALAIPVNDSTCGFKLLRLSAVREIAPHVTIERWAYDAELLTIAHVRGLRMKEIGVIWRNDPRSKVRILRDILRSAWDLSRIFVRARFHRYDRTA